MYVWKIDDDRVTNTRRCDDTMPNNFRHKEPMIHEYEKLEAYMAVIYNLYDEQ